MNKTQLQKIATRIGVHAHNIEACAACIIDGLSARQAEIKFLGKPTNTISRACKAIIDNYEFCLEIAGASEDG